MKISVVKTLALTLAFVLCVALFVGCGEKTESPTDVVSNTTSVMAPVIVEVEADAPYTVSKDANNKDIIILIPGANNTVIMTVAENTTLESFLSCVTAKEGYVIKVSDEKGKEVTDPKAKITKNMVFEVLKKDTNDSQVKLVINVVSQGKIDDTIQDQLDINSHNATVSNPTVSNNTNSNTTTKNEKIVLSSIWSATYSGDDAGSIIWQNTFDSLEKKGFTTSVINLTGDVAADIVIKDVMAGKTSVDVYEASAYISRCIARKGCLADLGDCKTLNYSNFDNAGTTSMSFGKHLYGVSIDFKATKIMGILYNKDFIKKHAPDYDIEKLFKEKKWTFDTFQALAKTCTKDTNGDGKPDIHGLTSNTNVIGMALTANAGGTALMKNGRVEATMCSEAGVTALEFMKKLYNTDRSWKFFASIKDSVNYFANGQSAMFASWMDYYTDIIPKASFKVGFVLMPIGPDQKDYISGQYDAQFYIVPKTKADRLDVIGEWLNGVSSASGKLISNKLRNLAINGLDKNTQDIYKWGVNNATPEYSSGLFSKDVSSQVDSCVTTATKSPKKIMAAIKSKAQKELDDFFAPLY